MCKRTTFNSLLAGLTKEQQNGLVNALVQYAQCLNAEESRNAVAPSFKDGGRVCVFCGPRGGCFHNERAFNEHAKHCPCEPPDINKLVETIGEWNRYSYERVRSEARKLSELMKRKGV